MYIPISPARRLPDHCLGECVEVLDLGENVKLVGRFWGKFYRRDSCAYATGVEFGRGALPAG
jgi:hypothetical protein